jgi:hypothetical protein
MKVMEQYLPHHVTELEVQLSDLTAEHSDDDDSSSKSDLVHKIGTAVWSMTTISSFYNLKRLCFDKLCPIN